MSILPRSIRLSCGSDHWRVRPRPGFSMIEMMIALVILGLGLLFIAAALPAAVEYSRQTVDRVTAEAAQDYAVETIRESVRTSKDLWFEFGAGPGQAKRIDQIFRPRSGPVNPPPNAPATVNNHEPIIKVRPFVMGNIGLAAPNRARSHVDDTESIIRAYLGILPYAGLVGAFPMGEMDYPALTGWGLADVPPLPGIQRVYPPISPMESFEVSDFILNNGVYRKYLPRNTSTNDASNFDGVTTEEREKTLDRRLAWTAFYRRTSYEQGSDPLLYEVITIVTRRPTANHRYAFQDPSGGATAFQTPKARTPSPQAAGAVLPGADLLAPAPWLVTFTALPTLPAKGAPPTGYWDDVPGPTLPLNQEMTQPLNAGTLRFTCSSAVGRLLPRGSIFIPARNDDRPTALAGLGPAQRRVAYIPTSPSAAPIFEVVDRIEGAGATTIVAKYDGLLPFLVSAVNTDEWPVWVIPPAFAERRGGQPVFSNESPIVSVSRTVMRLHEIPKDYYANK